MKQAEPPRLTGGQRAILAGVTTVLTLCLLVACLAGRWAWGTLKATPTPMPVAIVPTETHTPTPSPTPTSTPTWTATATPSSTPTSTSTPMPTHTPTHTPTPVPTATPSPSLTPTLAPVVGMMIGNAWLRQEPAADSPTLGTVALRGQQVELLAVYGEWCQIRWSPRSQAQVVGWVPLRWVGVLDSIPAHIITPTSVP
jgi:hypothetical protein